MQMIQTSTTSPAIAVQAQTATIRQTELPLTKSVPALNNASASRSGYGTNGGDDSMSQKAAAIRSRIADTLGQPSLATPASIIGAKVHESATPSQTELKRFDRDVPPDPLPTAPILKHFAEINR
ncbi:hypothetical protein [Sulfitobacter sp. S190]|uniref:hypothetical protein n=1 Tax=Sulfitobacter sp. S190 TaxID=2867022 RepID=UPI0021A6E1C5|nr:hypothetical protein [Sulfitobacter sp. S190]UWR22058.1 hypothetical protein K3756_15475 [Sulfitobacter sp. S190]